MKAIILKVNDKILDKYIGFNIRHTGKYFEILNLNLFKNFENSNLERVYLEINQKTILGLELQRKIKSENNGELGDMNKLMLPAKIYYEGEKYSIKMRTKGARLAHYADKDETSYKIDIKGSKRLWGMEEFSFQKPITKNYTYEYLFHKLLGHVGALKVKYFFINLHINDIEPHTLRSKKVFLKK